MNIAGGFSLFSFTEKSTTFLSLIALSVTIGSRRTSSLGIPVIVSELFNLNEWYSSVKLLLEQLKSPCSDFPFSRVILLIRVHITSVGLSSLSPLALINNFIFSPAFIFYVIKAKNINVIFPGL